MRFRRGMLDIGPILYSLKNHPEEWRLHEYTLDNKTSGLELWKANGFFMYHIHRIGGAGFGVATADIKFSLRQKARLWWAFKRFKWCYRKISKQEIAAMNMKFAAHFVKKPLTYGGSGQP